MLVREDGATYRFNPTKGRAKAEDILDRWQKRPSRLSPDQARVKILAILEERARREATQAEQEKIAKNETVISEHVSKRRLERQKRDVAMTQEEYGGLQQFLRRYFEQGVPANVLVLVATGSRAAYVLERRAKKLNWSFVFLHNANGCSGSYARMDGIALRYKIEEELIEDALQN